VNLICRRVYFALRRLWSTASFTPVGTRRKLALSLVVPLFFYCDVVCSKTSAGRRHKLKVAFNSCARYVYGVSRRDHISDYANSLLGMPLGMFFSFGICCQMYIIVSSGEPGYLYDSIQFGRSRRLGGIIITSPQLRYNSSLILCSWGSKYKKKSHHMNFRLLLRFM
jgi:hypothetical protein